MKAVWVLLLGLIILFVPFLSGTVAPPTFSVIGLVQYLIEVVVWWSDACLTVLQNLRNLLS